VVRRVRDGVHCDASAAYQRRHPVAWCATDSRDSAMMVLVGACALAQHLTESVDDCAPLIVTPLQY
jgi:hypothetical protein